MTREKEGYISLDRNILKWGWYKDQNVFKVFVHLIITANFTDGTFRGVTVHRGQRATSYPHLAEETGLSVKEVRNAINKLKRTGEIAHQPMHDFSLISVINYEYYQGQRAGQRAGNGQAVGRQRAGKGQQYNKGITQTGNKEKDSPPAIDDQ